MKKTYNLNGLKIVFDKNTDKNKVFTAVIKTPVHNNKGVPHVLEHLILCGSTNYPIRDPFNELAKSSIYTYLNAITYNDRTIYPVASKNSYDFEKMTKVYIDSIFNPLLNKDAFYEEGVFFNGEFNGIAYNEMKNVYSDSDTIADAYIYKELFESGSIKYDSGGIINEMSELKYADVIDYYNKYYVRENITLYFYGDIDIDIYLNYIKEVCNLDKNEKQLFIDNKAEIRKEVFIDEKIPEGEIYKIAFTMDRLNDFYNNNCLSITLDYLLSAQTSPLHKFLYDKYNFTSIDYVLDDDNIHPIVILTLKGSDINIKKVYDEIIKFLKNEVNNLNEQRLIKLKRNLEFSIIEEDFGYKPKGLGYLVENLKLWNYIDTDETNFKNEFKCNIKEETTKCINEFFINNKHYICGSFKEGNTELLLENKNREKDHMVESSYGEVIIDTIDFEDIKLEEYTYFENKGHIKYYPSENDNITYASIIFEIENIDYKVLGLYMDLLTYMPLKDMKLDVLDEKIDELINSFDINYISVKDKEYLIVDLKVFNENFEEAIKLIKNILFNTSFEDENLIFVEKRIKELIHNIEDSLVSDNDDYAVTKALSGINRFAWHKDMIEGIEYLEFLKKTVNDKCRETNNMLYNLTKILYNGWCECYLCTSDVLCDSFTKVLFDSLQIKTNKIHKNIHRNKEKCYNGSINNYCVASDVSTNVLVYKLDNCFDGHALVLCNLIKNDYMNENIRLKNGAYGFDFSITRDNYLIINSVNDNYVKESYEIFYNIKNIDLSKYTDDEIKKHIVGVINYLVYNKNYYSKYSKAIIRDLEGLDNEYYLNLFNEIMSTNKDILIKKLNDIYSNIKEESIFSIGNKEKIESYEMYRRS